MQQEKQKQKKQRAVLSPIETMERFRSDINAHYFGEPLASSESFMGYALGVALHVALALVAQTIWPLVVVVLLLMSAVASRQLFNRTSEWHIFEFSVIAVELIIIAVVAEQAFVAVVFIAAVQMYRASFAFGARRGLYLSLPILVVLMSVYGLRYYQGNEPVSIETAFAILLAYLLLVVNSFAETIVIGSVLNRVQIGDDVNSKNVGSLEAVFQSIGEAIIGVDESMRVTFANPQALDVLGLDSLDDLVGVSPHRLGIFVDKDGKKLPQELDPFKLSYESVATINYRISTVNKIYMKDETGEVLPAGLTVSPIMSHGKAVGVVAVLQDISGDSAVDKGKSDFVALASHHLRTPINAMRWNLERLMKRDTDNLTDKQKSMIETVAQSNKRILSLVNNLLSVSRIETGTLQIARKDVDTGTLLSAALESVTELRHEKSVDVQVTTDNNLHTITQSDEYIVRVVFENLLANALNYTPEDGKVMAHLGRIDPALYVQVIGGQNVVAPAGGVLLKVADTGIGITKKDQKNIFEKLYRADNARQIYADGTGIGLYLSRQLVAAIGGKLWFESNQDKGSVFYVFLPAAPPEQQS